MSKVINLIKQENIAFICGAALMGLVFYNWRIGIPAFILGIFLAYRLDTRNLQRKIANKTDGEATE